jgi:hypothetical protein
MRDKAAHARRRAVLVVVEGCRGAGGGEGALPAALLGKPFRTIETRDVVLVGADFARR